MFDTTTGLALLLVFVSFHVLFKTLFCVLILSVCTSRRDTLCGSVDTTLANSKQRPRAWTKRVNCYELRTSGSQEETGIRRQ